MKSALMALLLSLVPSARAADTADLLGAREQVPPVVIFVVDRSASMDARCSGPGSDSCMEETLDAIQQVTRHWDTAAFGVVGTNDDGGRNAFSRIAPVGSSYAEIASALSTVSAYSGPTRNLAEVLESLSASYLRRSAYDADNDDDDGDGMSGDWLETPIGYSCTDVHVIVLAKGRPVDDWEVGLSYRLTSAVGDIRCDSSGLGPWDLECAYDNVVRRLYTLDHSSLSGTQRAVVHTISLGVGAGSIAERLFQSASNNTDGNGIYTDARNSSQIVSAILTIMREIAAGTSSRSTPTITADGGSLLYTYYEVTGDNLLPQGHLRAYEIDDNPLSPAFGDVLYDGPSAYGGALWDAGNLLASRPVSASESNPDDRDGVGKRDIYTFEPLAYERPSLKAEASLYGRMGFDKEFADAVGADDTTLDSYLKLTGTTADCSNPYDFTNNCHVNKADLQALIDFVRGMPAANFRNIELSRGPWKLGDSPYSTPVAVTARDDNFSSDATYREFLSNLVDADLPSIVLLAANDGMLHAFRLEDDPAISGDQAGQELWAWVPGYLLRRDKAEEWANSLVDLMWNGKTFLFDGSPVVEDVWIDKNGDGVKAVNEWHRIVVVQQGLGGPVTLALDITDTTAPRFLWEQRNTTDRSAQGYGTGRPVVFNLSDARYATSPDQWVAMWGGGRPAGYTGASGTNYHEASEANLYMKNVGDDYWGSESVGYANGGDNSRDRFPDHAAMGGGASASDLDIDADLNLEHGYIASALAAVDVDNDGDVDVLYFPVTTTYLPIDQGGGGVGDPEDPGSSWLYKAIVNPSQPDDLTWCKFYDPRTGTDGTNGIGSRPEVHYAATTAWRADGSLGIYWGTGSPFDRGASNRGYFFAMYDEDPTSCTSVAQPIPCAGNDGYYPLDLGEGFTSDPLVFAGVVYFTTYVPEADRCETGNGRVYGLQYDDCSPGIDTNGADGVTPADAPYLESLGYVTGLTERDGVIYYANPDPDGTGDAVETIHAETGAFPGTAAIAWMEIY